MKKIFAAIVVGAFLFTTVPVITGTTETVYAAKGGAKISPKSAPKTAPKTNSAPKSNAVESAPKTGPNQKDYAPSKSAKDLNKEAPKTNSAAPAANAANSANSATSGMGNMMRNVGLFAGGMLLGGLIGNMLGMGGGMGEIFGILANVILLIFAFMAVRWLWRKFKNRNNENPYQNNYSNTNIDIPQIKNVTPTEDGYNAKTMADRYRNR